jgi:broad specificity phosphatase PhoE
MARLIFITHPEVTVDPNVPVERWGLSAAGIARMRRFAAGPVVAGVTAVWSSTEVKAIEAAGMLVSTLGLEVRQDPLLGENGRRATGFLPPAEFEKVAYAFFANPQQSVRGWERAVDAQQRIRRAVDRIAIGHGAGDLAVVSHGAVGTLLRCSYLGIPIDRSEDQPHQGHYWTATLPDMAVECGWLPIAPPG